MKKVIAFINGFVLCLLMFYSAFNYILWKWARGENVCGLRIDVARRREYWRQRPDYTRYRKYRKFDGDEEYD